MKNKEFQAGVTDPNWTAEEFYQYQYGGVMPSERTVQHTGYMMTQFAEEYLKLKNTRQPELNLQEVEKLVRSAHDHIRFSLKNDGHYLTLTEKDELRADIRSRIGYTLSDLEAKGGKG